MHIAFRLFRFFTILSQPIREQQATLSPPGKSLFLGKKACYFFPSAMQLPLAITAKRNIVADPIETNCESMLPPAVIVLEMSANHRAVAKKITTQQPPAIIFLDIRSSPLATRLPIAAPEIAVETSNNSPCETIRLKSIFVPMVDSLTGIIAIGSIAIRTLKKTH